MKNKQTTSERSGDIKDNIKDEKYLRAEETTMDLPEVKDIPGQEHVHPPKMKAFADTTISSDDEEGKNVEGLNDEDDDDEINTDTDVSADERILLEQTEQSTAGQDDINQQRATLDNTDDDGEELNQVVDTSGVDLDVPGSEDDDENEEIGEEDEENNSYSLGADKKD